MSWFYLALLAPLLYAIVNLIDDNLLRSMYKGPYVASMLSGMLGVLPALSLIFVDWTPISRNHSLIMLFTGFLTAIYYFFYFKALDVESPSIVIAMLGVVPAVLPVFSGLLLGETLNLQQIAGFIIILIATFFLAVSFDELKKPKFTKALAPISVVIVLLTVISLLSKYVYERADFYPAYIMFTLGMGLGGIYFLLIILQTKPKHDLSMFRRRAYSTMAIFTGVELIAIAAEYVSNLAVSKGPLSLVRVIEGTQPMYVLIIALLLAPFWPKHFREASEGSRVKKLVMMALMVVGLFLIERAS